MENYAHGTVSYMLYNPEKGKVKSLGDQLQEKEKYIYDLETKVKVNQGNRIVDEKNFAESNMAIKALEDALREKDQAMERERERFQAELEVERKKRTEFEIQVNNPEEGNIFSFSKISHFLERILMEHTELICSLESKLFFISIRSIRTCSRK